SAPCFTSAKTAWASFFSAASTTRVSGAAAPRPAPARMNTSTGTLTVRIAALLPDLTGVRLALVLFVRVLVERAFGFRAERRGEGRRGRPLLEDAAQRALGKPARRLRLERDVAQPARRLRLRVRLRVEISPQIDELLEDLVEPAEGGDMHRPPATA